MLVDGAGHVRRLHARLQVRPARASASDLQRAVRAHPRRASRRRSPAIAATPAAFSYENHFTCIPAAVPFRPPRRTPRPVVEGVQTAVVVGVAGRGDLHRQVRPREGAVPLGPRGQEGREQLVLDPRVAAVGRQGLGLGVDPAHRPGGDRRLPRGRSRPADHHRPRLQRRADAAVRAAGRRRGQRR